MTIAVLGLGSIGLRHARNLVALGQRVVAFDPCGDRGEALAKMGGRLAPDRRAAIDGAEAVVIASPNLCHLDDLRAALEAGRPAFVEKPLAHTPDGVETLLDAAARQGLAVFAGLNLRFHPAVVEAHRMISADEFGKPLWARLLCSSYLPDWRPGQDYRANYAADSKTGGVLFDIVHEFDLAHHLLGPARTVAAAARRSGLLDMASEDLADVLLRHGSGVISSLHLDYVTRPSRRITEIAGERGLLWIDIPARRLTLIGPEGEVLREETYVTTIDDDYRNEMAAFLACLAGKAKPPCDGREALAVLREVVAARALAGLPAA